MSDVFLDTVGLLALWDQRDQWHDAAERAFAAIRAPRSTVLTTTFVLLECGNAAARRPYRFAVDYALIGRHARLIVDTRNAMARVPAEQVKARILKA